MLKDPVCGKKIREAKYAGARITIDGIRYYFCSMECKTEFLHNPEKYVLNKNDGEIEYHNQNFLVKLFNPNS